MGRHGPMVWGVCRRVLRDPTDAEDAFQATFLVLIRRAHALREQGLLGPWLHGVALRVALRARSQARRRRARELQGMLEVAAPSEDTEHSELKSIIDAECRRLPARYAGPIVLCLVEGLSYEEAAQQLDCPLNTLKGRLARGRKQLQSRLVRRGVTPSVAVLTELLRSDADAAALDPLVQATVRTVQSLAGRSVAALAPGSALRLAEGVLQMMVLRWIKIAGVALAAVGLFAAVTISRATGHDDPAPKPVKAPLIVAQAAAKTPDDEPLRSYTVLLSPKRVYEFPSLNMGRNGLQLKSGPVAVVPMTCEHGTTGMMIIGNGTFSLTRKAGKPLEGSFRAAMLRFNPKDETSLINLEAGKKVTDYGAYEMTRHLTRTIFHCWHRGEDALIPPPGALAVVLYSREHGDLLISGDDKEEVIHSFTEPSTIGDFDER